MDCERCGGRMTMLFIHYVCDECNPPKASAVAPEESAQSVSGFTGFIVFRSRPDGSCEYVFNDLENAKKWRAAAGVNRYPIYLVEMNREPHWRKSTGSVKDLVLADRLFEIYRSRTHSSGPIAWLIHEAAPGE